MDWIVVAIAVVVAAAVACAIVVRRRPRVLSASTGLGQEALVRACRLALRGRGWRLRKGWFTYDMVVQHKRFGQRAILCKAGIGAVTPTFVGNASAHFRTAKQPLALVAGEPVPEAIRALARTRNTVILTMDELDRLEDWPTLLAARPEPARTPEMVAG